MCTRDVTARRERVREFGDILATTILLFTAAYSDNATVALEKTVLASELEDMISTQI